MLERQLDHLADAAHLVAQAADVLVGDRAAAGGAVLKADMGVRAGGHRTAGSQASTMNSRI